jgi:hypothetical protein
MIDDADRDFETSLRRYTLRQCGSSPAVVARARESWGAPAAERLSKAIWTAAAAALVLCCDWWLSAAANSTDHLQLAASEAYVPTAIPGLVVRQHPMSADDLAARIAKLHSLGEPSS